MANAFQSSILTGLLFVVGFITVPLWWFLHRKIGSKTGFMIAIILYIGSSMPLFFITDYMHAAYTAAAMGVGFGGMLYYIYLIIADVVDEDELKTGVRREGTFFGITNFFMRLSMIFSILAITIVFEGTGWGEWTPDPGVTTEFGIRFLVVGFPSIALVIVFICLIFFPFSKKSTTVFTPAPRKVPDGQSRIVCRLQVSSKSFLRLTEALSILLRKVFFITTPARPPAFRDFMKC